MLEYSKHNLKIIAGLLQVLPEEVYCRPSNLLSQASIGQHVRHIVELYQGLLSGYDKGPVNYDNRKRDRSIETDIALAQKGLTGIIESIDRPNKPLQLIAEIDGRQIILESNYDRELMYNLEHAIHHMALIKVGVIAMTDIVLPVEFGVAPATLQYRAESTQWPTGV